MHPETEDGGDTKAGQATFLVASFFLPCHSVWAATAAPPDSTPAQQQTAKLTHLLNARLESRTRQIFLPERYRYARSWLLNLDLKMGTSLEVTNFLDLPLGRLSRYAPFLKQPPLFIHASSEISKQKVQALYKPLELARRFSVPFEVCAFIPMKHQTPFK